ncbi:hypothetical protein [Roseococcus sp. YIM B11640]|uniref:hypothetical protein n=1 Tax=Roseococcus sp. YIM B11640 TaxID=3133973 RepID=UPI003C7D573C
MNKIWICAAALGVLGACSSPEPYEPRVRPAGTASAAPAGQACDGSFRVVNNSSKEIHQVFVSDSALTTRGRDRLGRTVLPVGRSVNLNADGPGANDMVVVLADRRTIEQRRLPICRNTTVIVTDSAVRVE